MNSVIVIRGEKIAFNKYPGEYGIDDFIAPDLKELMTPYGLFIPIIDWGTRVITMLNPEKTFNTSLMNDVFYTKKGLAGALIACIPDGVQYNRIGVVTGADGKTGLSSIPLLTGTEGFAVLSSYHHMQQDMMTCIHLTQTIEDTVDMYCRHVKSNRDHVLIWDMKDCAKFIKENHKPKHDL